MLVKILYPFSFKVSSRACVDFVVLLGDFIKL